MGGELDVVEADDDKSSGTLRPTSAAARIAPIAIRSAAAKIAVGRSGSVSRCSVASRADSA